MKKMTRTLIAAVCLLLSVQVNAQSPKKTQKKEPVHTTVRAPRGDKQQRVLITTDYGPIIVKLYNETPKHRDNFIKLVKEGFYDSLLFHRVIKSFMIQGGDPTSKTADSASMLGSGDNGYRIPAEIKPTLFHKRGALAAARDNNPEKASSGCQFYIVQGKKYTAQELEQIINAKNLNNKQAILYNLYQTDSIQKQVYQIQQSGDKEKLRAYMEQLQVVVDQRFAQEYPNATNVDQLQVTTYMEEGGAPHLDGAYTVFGEVESGMEVVDKIAAQVTRPSDNRPVVNIRMKMRLL